MAATSRSKPRYDQCVVQADARLAPLEPILRRRGLRLIERGAGNLELADRPGLILKDSYWRWPDREMSGNAIDLLTRVMGLSFHDAMTEITRT